MTRDCMLFFRDYSFYLYLCRHERNNSCRLRIRIRNMTVKEVFDLRKQGRIEEAYQIIRPMYAVHKGKYTTLCMFWTASDILKKRIKEHKYDEAEKIFKSLVRILPNIEDREGSAHRSIYYGALALDREKEEDRRRRRLPAPCGSFAVTGRKRYGERERRNRVRRKTADHSGIRARQTGDAGTPDRQPGRRPVQEAGRHWRVQGRAGHHDDHPQRGRDHRKYT